MPSHNSAQRSSRAFGSTAEIPRLADRRTTAGRETGLDQVWRSARASSSKMASAGEFISIPFDLHDIFCSGRSSTWRAPVYSRRFCPAALHLCRCRRSSPSPSSAFSTTGSCLPDSEPYITPRWSGRTGLLKNHSLQMRVLRPPRKPAPRRGPVCPDWVAAVR